jgi:hypothetical protein
MAFPNRVLIAGGALLAGIATIGLALFFASFLTPLVLHMGGRFVLFVPLIMLLSMLGAYLRRMQAKKRSLKAVH